MQTLMCDRALSTPKSPVVKVPVIKVPVLEEKVCKFPVTQEVIATHLGRNLPVTKLAHSHYAEELHTGVKHLIIKQASKYGLTIKDYDIEDMVQDVWYRIIKKLYTYKAPPRGAKFTTWVYRVSSSVLDKLYIKSQKRKGRMASMNESLDEERVSDEETVSPTFGDDVRDTITKLKKAYPEKLDMINAMFVEVDGDLRCDIVYKHVADRCGSTGAKVSDFFRQVVRPFFIEQFKGGQK